MSKMVIWKSNI